MAEKNPPIWIQAGTHPAEDARRYLDALSAGRAGIIGSGDLAVTQNGGGDMTVNVAAGRAVLVGTQSAFQGTYGVDARTTTNLAIAAADTVDPRKDLVVAKVQDQAYSGGTSAWSLAVVTGVPAPTPVEPAAPNNSLILAMIDVPANDTAITTSQITDRRTITGRAAALGGVIVCTATTRPPHSAGRVIYEVNTGNLLVSTGSAWTSVAGNTTFLQVRKTADESVTSSTVQQPDNHLFLPVSANTNYLVEGAIALSGYYPGGTTAVNIGFSWSAPAAAQMRWGIRSEDTLSGPGSYNPWTTAGTTTIWLYPIGQLSWSQDPILVGVYGIVQVSTTAGNLQLLWGQGGPSSYATTVYTGSWLRITPVT